MFLPAEGFFVAALFAVRLFDVCGSFLNKVQRQIVAFFVIVVPVDQPVLAEHHAFGLRMFLGDTLQLQAQFKARAQPRRPDDVIAINRLCDAFGIFRSADGDGRVGVRMVHVLARHERMQRRIDGRRTRVEVKRTVRIHPHHLILRRRLGPALFLARVHPLQCDQLLLIQRRKIFFFGCPQITARALHPKHLHRVTRERVGFGKLAGSIPSAGIGDALIAAENVRAINQPLRRIQSLDLTAFPEVVHILVFSLRHKNLPSQKIRSALSPPKRAWIQDYCLNEEKGIQFPPWFIPNDLPVSSHEADSIDDCGGGGSIRLRSR